MITSLCLLSNHYIQIPNKVLINITHNHVSIHTNPSSRYYNSIAVSLKKCREL